MKKKFVLNDTVLFEPEKNSLTSIHAKPVQKIILHTPASECLRQLLLHNDQVVSQKLLFEQVWEKNGAFVTVNTLYQNIVSLRKGLKAAGITEDVIKTLPKIGFRISVKIEEVQEETAIFPSGENPKNTGDSGEEKINNQDAVKGETHSPFLRFFFQPKNIRYLYLFIVAFILIALWVLFYQKYPEGRSYYDDYYYVGKVNGCQLFSSHPGTEVSKDIFSLFVSHHSIKCQSDSVAYMTINRMYAVSSVILCNKKVSEDDSQCKSFLFRGSRNEK